MTKKNPTRSETLRELAEQTALADSGEAASVFLHELGNLLNNLLLSNKLLQRQLPEEFQSRLAAGCTLINEAAQQMRELAQFRQGQRSAPYPVDLNATVREVLSTHNGATAKIQARLAEALPPILTTLADLKRIVQLLIQNALAVSVGQKEPVSVHTSQKEKYICLEILDQGTPVDPDKMRFFFEPFQRIRDEQNNLEMAICKNLVRRLQGKLEAENRQPRGVHITAAWPIDHQSY